jgi:hypothetical protein
MRRIFVAAVGAALLVGTAACGDGGSSGGAGTTASPTPSPTATASVSASDRQVCTDAEKVIEDSTRKFGQEVLKAVQAGSSAEAQSQAVNAVRTLFADTASGLRTQADKASNADLKSALNEFATSLDRLRTEINTVEDLRKLGDLRTPELDAAADKVQRICG